MCYNCAFSKHFFRLHITKDWIFYPSIQNKTYWLFLCLNKHLEKTPPKPVGKHFLKKLKHIYLSLLKNRFLLLTQWVHLILHSWLIKQMFSLGLPWNLLRCLQIPKLRIYYEMNTSIFWWLFRKVHHTKK